MKRQTKEEKPAGPMYADQEPDKIENRNSHFRCRLCGHNTEQSYCFLAPVGSSADGWFPATCPNCKAEHDVGDVGSGFVGIRLKAQKLKPTEHPKCLSCLAGMKYTGQDYTDRSNINRTFTCRDCGEPHTARKIGRGIKWLRQTKMVPLLDEPAKPDAKPDALELTEELFAFLQGKIPAGCKIARKHRPKLTPDQAWTVIWYVQNQYAPVPDHIERCEVCGSIYDSNREGDTLDYGGLPYSFCDNCMTSETYARKMRRNPDKNEKATKGMK